MINRAQLCDFFHIKSRFPRNNKNQKIFNLFYFAAFSWERGQLNAESESVDRVDREKDAEREESGEVIYKKEKPGDTKKTRPQKEPNKNNNRQFETLCK